MDDLRLLGMEVVERIEQLISPRQNLVCRKRPAFARHHLRQVIAGDKLHDEKLAVGFGKMVADAWQRRMMQASEQTGLALELLSQAFIRKKRLFQRHGRIETLVDRLVNRAHAALPELAPDAIPAL